MNIIAKPSWHTFFTVILGLGLCSIVVQACDSDSGFKETKSGSLTFEPSSEIGFDPVFPGQSSSDSTFKITHGGERSVVISSIYLAVPNEEGEYSPVDGCDRITEEIPRDQILVPEVLPGCVLLISERPSLPFEINNNSTEQVLLTYRPLLDGPDPSAMKLIVESNATGMYQEVFDISVSVARPEISTERVIEFASSGENTKNHLVRNNSTANLKINQIRIERNIEGSPAPIDPATDMPVDEFLWDTTCPVGDRCILNSVDMPFMSIQVTYRPFDEVGPDKATMIIEASTESGEAFAPVEVLLTTEANPTVLTINPNPMVFNPAQNQEGRLEVSFVNGGLSSVGVFAVSFEPEEGPFTLRGAQNSFSVEGGVSYELTVFALPSEIRSGTMVVETDADNAENGVIRVPISVGTGGAVGLLTSDTSRLDFNGVAPTESLEQSVTLTSNGTDPVQISEVRIEGDIEEDIEVFEVISGGDISSLNANETAEVTVRFTRPQAAPGAPLNTYAATLVIANDSLGGDVTVNLNASPLP